VLETSLALSYRLSLSFSPENVSGSPFLLFFRFNNPLTSVLDFLFLFLSHRHICISVVDIKTCYERFESLGIAFKKKLTDGKMYFRSLSLSLSLFLSFSFSLSLFPFFSLVVLILSDSTSTLFVTCEKSIAFAIVARMDIGSRSPSSLSFLSLLVSLHRYPTSTVGNAYDPLP
jgi:hypothetical protein